MFIYEFSVFWVLLSALILLLMVATDKRRAAEELLKRAQHDLKLSREDLTNVSWVHEDERVRAFINRLAIDVHQANEKWWTDLETGEYPIKRNVPELLCLVHSEVSEAMEGYRKNLMDDKLPHRKMIEVELVDAIIRIFDIGHGLRLDLGGAYVEKMAYNATRADHSLEARKGVNGKKF